MLMLKINPQGVDVHIQKLQTIIHDRLLVKWGITTNQYKAYGRCYRNRTTDGYTAEWYEGNGEYKEVYWNDSYFVTSFFGINYRENKGAGAGSDVQVHLVFFADLPKLKPAIAHRADEEVRKDVAEIIGTGLHGISLDSIDLYLENCLKEYPATVRKAQSEAKFDNHPIHCFRLNFTLRTTKKYC